MTGSRNCTQEDLLSAYLDGELAEDVAMELRRHLDGCPRCTGILEAMKTGDRLLIQSLPAMQPPAYLKARLLQGIEADINKPSAFVGIRQLFSFRLRSWAYACAPIVLLAAVISAFQMQQRIENRKILVQIDHSRAEWVAHDKADNPFNIDVNGTPLRPNGSNPFEAYLNRH
jgi:anti-sigma factor RsiW